jgi:hypothetical protein
MDNLQGRTTTYLRGFDKDYILKPTIVLDIAHCACMMLMCMLNAHRFPSSEVSDIDKLFGH